MFNETIKDLSTVDEINESWEDEEEDEIVNLEFQKDNLEKRSQASKQSRAEEHRHKPPNDPPSKKTKLTDQEKKVIAILEGNPQMTRVSNNSFEFSSLASDKTYLVKIEAEKCSCNCDAKQRWKKNINCKHIISTLILLGVKKEGIKEKIYASERKQIPHCLSLFNGQVDDERKNTFVTKFKSSRDLRPDKKNETKKNKKIQDRPAEEPHTSQGTSVMGVRTKLPKQTKPKPLSNLVLDQSISSYQEAKKTLDEHGSEYKWSIEINQSPKRQCPNHYANDKFTDKKIGVGQRAVVGEYLHLWMRKAGAKPMIIQERKYFHENCINDFKARTLSAEYVNLRPPRVIEIEDKFDNQFVEKLIREMNLIHPLVTFKDLTGQEIRIGQNGKLRRGEPQPGLAELRQKIDDNGDLVLEESEDEYNPPSTSTSDLSFSSPVKKKPKK